MHVIHFNSPKRAPDCDVVSYTEMFTVISATAHPYLDTKPVVADYRSQCATCERVLSGLWACGILDTGTEVSLARKSAFQFCHQS